eukprot:8029345-Pyramimonas_sp.AAC.1
MIGQRAIAIAECIDPDVPCRAVLCCGVLNCDVRCCDCLELPEHIVAAPELIDRGTCQGDAPRNVPGDAPRDVPGDVLGPLLWLCWAILGPS